jgi:trans-aconitate methyltransferase
MSSLKLYEELAHWWLLLSPPDDYTEEVAFFLEALHDAHASPHGTLLDLGSGGGSNAFLLKEHFTLTLVDLSPKMLDVSRSINPECEHIVGDMRTIRLDKQFDVVFVHDAIDYMITEADLRQAIETAFIHCKPGGIALFVPDHLQDTFEDSSDHGGNDGEERSLRYMEWTFDPDETDNTTTTHYVFMLREGESVHVEHDQHVCGLFARAQWFQWLEEAGFQVTSRIDSYDREVFVATRPHNL